MTPKLLWMKTRGGGEVAGATAARSWMRVRRSGEMAVREGGGIVEMRFVYQEQDQETLFTNFKPALGSCPTAPDEMSQ